MIEYSQTCSVTDPEIWHFVEQEMERQERHIELIASENYVSAAVMNAQGSQLTNKLTEGLPGRRYYGGCDYIDEIERIAIRRAQQVFCEPAGVEMAVNVQPHSGAQANQAVMMGFLENGDSYLGMSLADGGHLSHGMKINFSGRFFNPIPYGLKDDETIDYDEVERLAREHRPKLIIAGASAYSLRMDFKRFADIAHSVGALLMVDMAHYAGLIAAGVYPTPFGHADIVTTTTHKSLRGPRGGLIFARPELEKKMNSGMFPGIQGAPLVHVMCAKAVALGEALRPEFKAYGEQVVRNAAAMCDQLQKRGVRIVSGGTESHMMLLDCRSKGMTGKAAETLLSRAHITANKNAIHNDPEKPSIGSGLRFGTPAVTTRGFREEECRMTADFVVDLLEHPDDEAVIERVRNDVDALTARFPVYHR